MVYVDPKNLGYRPYWEKYVNSRQSRTEGEFLMKLYEKYVPDLIDMIVEGIVDGKQGEKLKTIVPLTNLNMVSVIFTKYKNILSLRFDATHANEKYVSDF